MDLESRLAAVEEKIALLEEQRENLRLLRVMDGQWLQRFDLLGAQLADFRREMDRRASETTRRFDQLDAKLDILIAEIRG